MTGLTSCNQQTAPNGQIITVRPDTFQVKIIEVGVVEAQRVLPIVAPYRGKLIQIPDTGDFVEQDDLIVVLEDEEAVEEVEESLNELKRIKSELEAGIESLKIAMRSNSLDLDQAESELEFNRIRLEDVTLQLAETEVLLQQSVVPEDDMRNAQSETVMSRLNTMTRDLDYQSQQTVTQTELADNLSNIEQSRLQGDRVRQELNEAQEMIDSAKIKAPVSGLFQRTRRWDWRQQKMVEPKPGDDLRRGQVIGQIPDLDTLVVKSQVPERYYLQVEEGTPVEVAFDAYEGVIVTGSILRLGKVAIERQASPGGALVESDVRLKEKVFAIEVLLDDPPLDMKPGITSTVSVILDQQSDILSIPFAAVQPMEKEYLVQMRSGSSGAFQAVVIEPGKKNETHVVVNSGLQAGDQILIPEAADI